MIGTTDGRAADALAAPAAAEPSGAAQAPAARIRPAAPLAAALLAALVVEPNWPVHLVTSLLWFGGAWRPLAVPISLGAAVTLALANTLAPGAAWQALRAAGARLRSWAPAAAAIVVGLLAAGYSAGMVAGATAARAALLFALQVALFPGTPLVALALALAVAAALADARGEQLLAHAWACAARRRRPVGRAVGAVLPAITVTAAAAMLAAAIFPSAMQGWARAEGPDAQRYSFYSSFFNYAISADRIEQRDGYELGKLGLTLPPGRSGAIVFRLERPPDALVLLKANFYNRRFAESGALATTGAAFSNALEISTDQGQSYRTVLADASLGEVVGSPALDLTRFLGPSRTYWLRLRAHNSTESEVTVLPSVVVSTVTDPLALPHPAFPIVAYLAAVAAVAYTVCRRAGRRPRDAGAAALALSTGAAVVVALVRSFGGHPAGASAPAAAAAQAAATLAAGAGGPDLRYALLASRAAFALAAALPVALSWRWRRVGPPVARGPRTPWLVLGCLLVALVALDARWEQLMRVRYEFLLPDAQGYQAIAEQVPEKLAHYVTQRASPLLSELYAAGYDGRASAPAVFYAGGNNGREPLWPATLRLVFNVLGASAFHTRLTSLACGVLVAVLTCWVAWRLLHPLAGVTAGALLALNRPHIVNSVAGLREELVSALLLLLLSGLFVGARRGSPATWWRAAGVGAAAAAVVLVRADMVVLAGALLTGAALVLRWPWRRWFVAVGLMGLLAAPMYLGYAFTHGDPFYPGTYGATVNRNLEFPERMGTPGFPSPEEYAANWAAGPPVSPMQYFFGYHTLPQFVGYTVRGFIRIFPTVLFEQQPVVLWLFVAGMGLLLICRRWVVPFALVIALVPFYAFLAGVPNSWVFPGRYAHHALPYAEMGAAYALWFVPLGIVGRWRGRHGRRAGTSAALRGA